MFQFFICSLLSSRLHIFSTDLVIEFIARGVEINLLAFSYKKKPRGGGGGEVKGHVLKISQKEPTHFSCLGSAKLFQTGRFPFSVFRSGTRHTKEKE